MESPQALSAFIEIAKALSASSSSKHVSSYASLTAAVAAIGAVTPTRLIVDSATTCTAHTIITDNIEIEVTKEGSIAQGAYNLTNQGIFIHRGAITGTGAFTNTGKFFGEGGTIANSGAITLNGNLVLPPYYIFTGSGAVTIGNQSTIGYPEWYNANGTDSTDDTAAVSALFSAMPEGSTIHFNGKSYIVGDLLVTKSFNLQGNGGPTFGDTKTEIELKAGASFIFRFDATGQADTDFYNNAGYVNIPRIVGLQIRDLTFSGGLNTASYLVSIRAASHARITDCSFINANGVGLKLTDTMESVVNNNLFRRLNGGMYFGNYQGTYAGNNVNNLHIEENTFGLMSGDIIGSDAHPNLDMIWIVRNKFEYDDTPSWVNAGATAVIKMQTINRAWIEDNGFAYYTDANNHYSTILSLGGGDASAGPVSLTNNKLYQCSGSAWLVSAVKSVYEDGTTSINSGAALTYSFTTPYHVIGQKLIELRTNGDFATYPTNQPFPLNTFIPAYQLFSVSTRSLVTDANSKSDYKLAKTVAGGTADEIARWLIGAYSDYPGATNIIVTVRVKSANANDSVVQAYYDSTSLGTQAVTAAGGWQWKSFTVPKASITAASPFKIVSADVDGLLFDGMVITIS